MAERSIGREIYNSLVPSNVRVLAETAMGSTAPITEQDLTQADLNFLRRQYEETRGRNTAAESELIRRLGSSETEYMKNPLPGRMQVSPEGIPSQGIVPYADAQKQLRSYQTTRDRTAVGYSPSGSGVDTIPVGQAISRTMTDPEFRMATLLGRYQVVETPEGPTAVDRYDFNRMNTENSEALTVSDLVNAPVRFLDTAMRKYLPSASRPVNIRLGIPANQSYEQGGLITQEGPQMAMQPNQPAQAASTASLDLPPAIASLLDMTSIAPPMQEPTRGIAGVSGATSFGGMPSYADGGQIGPGGQPMPMSPMGAQPQMQMATQPGLQQPGATQQSMTPQQIQTEAQRFVQRNPQQVQQIQLAIQQGLQSGELTMEELNTLVQMATVALQNPALYPQLRALAIREGLATEQDISAQFDPGILMTLVIIGQSLQAQGMAQPVPPQQLGSMPQEGVSPAQVGGLPSMATGGPLPEQAKRKDGGIPIMAHEGEYVIPADIVRRKGTDFFDKMIQSDK